jgi:microcompartment protein CcmL/EutN
VRSNEENNSSMAVAMVELRTTAAGVAAADRVLKSAECPLFRGATVCPGKFLLLFGGQLAAVEEAYAQVEAAHQGELLDAFVLGHVSPTLLAALGGGAAPEARVGGAIGLLETFTAAGAVAGADAATKAADVELLEIRLAQGMTGKGLVYFSGEVAAVETALQAAAQALGDGGSLCATGCLPAPHEAVWQSLRG